MLFRSVLLVASQTPPPIFFVTTGSGTYLIKTSVRLTDFSTSRSLFQAVHTSNVDIADGIWQTNPSGQQRYTMLYNRIAYFNAGDLLRLYIYSDGSVANLSDASLNIVYCLKINFLH